MGLHLPLLVNSVKRRLKNTGGGSFFTNFVEPLRFTVGLPLRRDMMYTEATIIAATATIPMIKKEVETPKTALLLASAMVGGGEGLNVGLVVGDVGD